MHKISGKICLGLIYHLYSKNEYGLCHRRFPEVQDQTYNEQAEDDKLGCQEQF